MTELKNNKIENILALRGDKPISGEIQGDYTHAWQLIEQIKQSNDFGVAAACYPEGHLEAQNMQEDLNHLKYKVEAGVDYLITQMFFDNSLFYRFREQANNYGIKIPIEAGIMPVINKKQVGKIIELSGAYFPEKFKRIMLKYQDNPVALQDAGIAYAIEQIVDLISSEVDGIHLYTMNNPYVAKRIKSAVGSLISHINGLKNRQKNSPSLDKEH
jgi:methylenetetrahydrofolate reductase (NADPH)